MASVAQQLWKNNQSQSEQKGLDVELNTRKRSRDRSHSGSKSPGDYRRTTESTGGKENYSRQIGQYAFAKEDAYAAAEPTQNNTSTLRQMMNKMVGGQRSAQKLTPERHSASAARLLMNHHYTGPADTCNRPYLQEEKRNMDSSPASVVSNKEVLMQKPSPFNATAPLSDWVIQRMANP